MRSENRILQYPSCSVLEYITYDQSVHAQYTRYTVYRLPTSLCTHSVEFELSPSCRRHRSDLHRHDFRQHKLDARQSAFDLQPAVVLPRHLSSGLIGRFLERCTAARRIVVARSAVSCLPAGAKASSCCRSLSCRWG